MDFFSIRYLPASFLIFLMISFIIMLDIGPDEYLTSTVLLFIGYDVRDQFSIKCWFLKNNGVVNFYFFFC